jgi:PAS domain S-box-containing protein
VLALSPREFLCESMVERTCSTRRGARERWRANVVIDSESRGASEKAEADTIEGELRAQGSLLRLIVDALPALVGYVNADGTYRLLSRAYQAWFGVEPDQLVGKPIAAVLGASAYADVREHVERALSGERVQYEAEVSYARAGKRWIRAVYLPDIAQDGRVRGFVSLVQDISEQKRAEQRAADAAIGNEALARVGRALIAELDLETMFARLTDEATALCRAQFGAFFYNVVQEGEEAYMLYTVSGVPREAFSKFPMPRKTAVFAPTFAGTGIVRSDDITSDPRYGKSAPHHGMPHGHLPVRSYLALPVVSRSGVVHGGLFFGHEQAGVFKERDERLMVAVAAQAAVAIDNARLLAATSAAEKRYRALAESAPLFVWTTLADGTLDYLNRRFLDYLALGPEQLRQPAPLRSAIHPADVARVDAVWRESLHSGQPFEIEYRLRRGADGSYRWFLARGVPIREDDSIIARWVGSCTDIEDRKRNEEIQRFLAETSALLASSLDYRTTLTDVAKLCVPTLADACVIDVVDDASSTPRTLASSSSEVEQWLESRLLQLAGEWHSRAELSQRVVEGGSPLSDDTRGHDAAREREVVAWMLVPLVAQHQVLGSITLVSFRRGAHFEARDLAAAEELGRRAGSVVENARLFELARQEKRRAEEASTAKDLFLGTLSHELRTPLSAILGWARMLQSGSLSEDKHDRALATIERNARLQVAMIEDILDVARITSGKLRLDVAPVEIAQVVEAALDTIRPTAEAKSVRLQAVLDPDTGALHGDSPRLQQIVWNLLSNAVRFTPKGGRVYVVLRRADSSVEIAVSDTGIGIPLEFLPRVFERFSQADASRTRQQGGLGLGLSIVKHLTELHGGTVTADSAGPGQGATFTVRLPLAPLRDTPVHGPRTSRPPPRDELFCPPELDGLHVLVVDDEPDARELVQSALEACHARVTLAKSAAEALHRLKLDRPAVLVSDIGMPDEDGYSLIRKVRALPKADGGDVPAVALTAYAHIADRTRALMEGFNNHVSKPAEPQELIAVVAALAGRRRLRPTEE